MGVTENIEAACKETEAKGTNLTFGRLVFQGIPCAALSGVPGTVQSIKNDLADAEHYLGDLVAGRVSPKEALIAGTALTAVVGMAVMGKGQTEPESGFEVVVRSLFNSDASKLTGTAEARVMSAISTERVAVGDPGFVDLGMWGARASAFLEPLRKLIQGGEADIGSGMTSKGHSPKELLEAAHRMLNLFSGEPK